MIVLPKEFIESITLSSCIPHPYEMERILSVSRYNKEEIDEFIELVDFPSWICWRLKNHVHEYFVENNIKIKLFDFYFHSHYWWEIDHPDYISEYPLKCDISMERLIQLKLIG